jgi:hypothetical protein
MWFLGGILLISCFSCPKHVGFARFLLLMENRGFVSRRGRQDLCTVLISSVILAKRTKDAKNPTKISGIFCCCAKLWYVIWLSFFLRFLEAVRIDE